MKFPRHSSRETPQPRPAHAADVLAGIDDEQNDGIEFDPRRDISQRDWERIREYFDKMSREQIGWNFCDMASNLALIFPERKAEINLSNDIFEEMKKGLKRFRHGTHLKWVIGQMAMNIALLFPNRKIELSLNDEFFEWMKEELEQSRRGKNWWIFSKAARSLNSLFPDRKAELNLDNEAFEGMKGALEQTRRHKEWLDFSRMAAELCLLFPDRKAELKLDDKAFDGMKESFEEHRRDNEWWEARGAFVEFAKYLTILSAERAQITPDGRILITPKKPALSNAPPPLPERRHV